MTSSLQASFPGASPSEQSGGSGGSGESGGDVLILTCSMARDIDLFAILARSMDDLVAPEIDHLVIVPRQDVAAFARFATPRRRVRAQEDVLPMRAVKLPAALERLSAISGAFRRPLYLTAGPKLVRGWILQQILKIEAAQRATQRIVLHVDSDVFFIRPMAPCDAFRDGLPYFFAVGEGGISDEHRRWTGIARDVLGLDQSAPAVRHYVENCVPWAPEVVREMTARIESVHGRPWPQVVLGAGTLSEYFLYGQHVDLLRQGRGLAWEDVSFCLSWWPRSPDETLSLDREFARLHDRHVAMAVQSTHALAVDARAALYRQARAMADARSLPQDR